MADAPEPPEPPELIKWVQWLLHYLRQEGATVRGAPVLFVLIAAAAAFVGYLGTEIRFSDRLATAEDRLKLANEQVTSYKEKLQGASPEQAANGIAALREALEKEKKERLKAEKMLGARVLNDEERDAIISSLRGTKEKIHIFASQNDGEAFFYGREWGYALEEAGVAYDLADANTDNAGLGVAIYTLDSARWGKLIEATANLDMEIVLIGEPMFPNQPAESIVIGKKPIAFTQMPAFIRAFEKSLDSSTTKQP